MATGNGKGDGLRILVYARSEPERIAQALTERGVLDPIVVASDAEGARRYIADVDVVFAWRLPPELYALGRRLRWVQGMGAGVEDIVAAEGLSPGVVVTRIVDQFGASIGEYVFGELLARVRRLDEARTLQRERRWHHFVADTLAGRLIGVAGLGSIGREIVRKARAFDMRVYGLSRTGRYAALVDRHFGPDAWPAFVRELDVLVLTLPLTPETRAVVGPEVLAAMRPESVLVNVGRGALVPEAALIDALGAGRPGGAILDVFEREPLDPESPLWTLAGVTVTPHVSGPSRTQDIAAFFAANLARFKRGETLVGIVDREAGY
jgi:glyoxylate/hydroxypyruvate reductase A